MTAEKLTKSLFDHMQKYQHFWCQLYYESLNISSIYPSIKESDFYFILINVCNSCYICTYCNVFATYSILVLKYFLSTSYFFFYSTKFKFKIVYHTGKLKEKSSEIISKEG